MGSISLHHPEAVRLLDTAIEKARSNPSALDSYLQTLGQTKQDMLLAIADSASDQEFADLRRDAEFEARKKPKEDPSATYEHLVSAEGLQRLRIDHRRNVEQQLEGLWLEGLIPRAIGSNPIETTPTGYFNRGSDGMHPNGGEEQAPRVPIPLLHPEEFHPDGQSVPTQSEHRDALYQIALLYEAARWVAKKEADGLRTKYGIPLAPMDDPAFIERCKGVIQRQHEMGLSRGEVFHRIYYKAIDDRVFDHLYRNQETGAPNIPPALLVSLEILKRQEDVPSYKKLCERVKSDREFRRAVGLNPETEDGPCPETLKNFRRRCREAKEKYGKNPLEEQVKRLLCYQTKIVGAEASRVRSDSMLINNCADLSRSNILFRSTRNMVRKARKLGVDLDPRWQSYLLAGCNSPYRVLILLGQPESVARGHKASLQAMMEEALAMANEVSGIAECRGTEELALLYRVIKDQTKLVDGEIALKEGTEISPTSLQNPSSPEATFRVKGKGKDRQVVKGYAAGVTEVYDNKLEVSLIVDIDVQPSKCSDAELGETLIARAAYNRNLLALCIKLIAADGAYWQTTKREVAAKNSVRLQTTKEPGRRRSDAPTDPQKEAEHEGLKNYRAGVEGIPAVLRTKGDVDHLPVYGQDNVGLWLLLEAAGYNARQIESYGERIAKGRDRPMGRGRTA